MKRIVPFVFLASVLASCTTSRYVQADLPDYEPAIPERPVLTITEDPVPEAVNENMALLMGYARELEAYGKAWRDFYEELRNENQSE